MTTGGKPAKKPVRKSSKKPSRKSAKKPVRKMELANKTVPQLRKMAKSSKARQTNRDGTTKNKSQLMASIRAARRK